MNHDHGAQKGFLKDMEKFFHDLYSKVPWHFPTNVKEVIVKVGPWITLVLMVFAIPIILAALGLTALFSPVAMMYGGYHLSLGFLLAGIISLLSLVFEAIALPGLFARSLKGWYLIYYAALLSALGNLIRVDIFGLIIGLAISLYILFEIKPYYK